MSEEHFERLENPTEQTEERRHSFSEGDKNSDNVTKFGKWRTVVKENTLDKGRNMTEISSGWFRNKVDKTKEAAANASVKAANQLTETKDQIYTGHLF